MTPRVQFVMSFFCLFFILILCLLYITFILCLLYITFILCLLYITFILSSSDLPIIHLLYITRYITFSYKFRRTSAPSSASLIFKFSIFDETTCPKHLPKCVDKMQTSLWRTIFHVSRRSFVVHNGPNPESHNTSLWCGFSKVTKTFHFDVAFLKSLKPFTLKWCS